MAYNEIRIILIDIGLETRKKDILICTADKLVGKGFTQLLEIISTMDKFGFVIFYANFVISTVVITYGVDMGLIFVFKEVFFLRNCSRNNRFYRETQNPHSGWLNNISNFDLLRKFHIDTKPNLNILMSILRKQLLINLDPTRPLNPLINNQQL